MLESVRVLIGVARKGCWLAILLVNTHVALAQSDDSIQLDRKDEKSPAVQAGHSNQYPIESENKQNGWLEPGTDPENRLVSPFLKHIVRDQQQFWTAPARIKVQDLKWIAPLAGVTAAFIASDSWWAKQVPVSHIYTSKTVSDYGTYSLIGLGGASFLLGHMSHNDQLSETGLLAGEAAIDCTAVAYAFEEVTQRQRPYQDHGNGTFFAGGSSFPSEHSAIAWAIASVWAHEYPGWLSQAAAYGLASTITATRVTAKQHFPSDAIIGSVLGWYFGRETYRAHHDPELGGSGWGNFFEQDENETPRDPNYMASPYVELDSWIYPALDRLIALGSVNSGMLGMRPWTRMQCARLLEDAEDNFTDNGAEEGQAGQIYASLTSEFAPEIARLSGAPNAAAQVHEIYTRSMGITGKSLRDSYNFGQTMVNDFGRPYWEGYNNITGIIADAETGPVAFFLRAEYQHAPGIPSYPMSVQTAIGDANLANGTEPTPPFPTGIGETNRFQLLDSTASVNINNLQISVGNQSEWLGPGESGSFLMDNNAPPFPMVKIDDVVPRHIPGLSKVLGPARAEFFVGQLSGQHWEYCALTSCRSYPGYPGIVGPSIVPQPLIHGEKVSFQPTPNFEFGMGITAMFGGPGLPVTFGNFFRTYYVHSNTPANNPGKRISQADLVYRIPHMRDWLTFYLDSLVVDEPSPIGSTRANVSPGIYLPKLPGLHHLELRAEGINESRTKEFLPGFVYFDSRRYLNGYTNDGLLLGTPFGRAARGTEEWLTYWLSARNKIQARYRLQAASPAFIGGGRLVDYSLQSEAMLTRNVSVTGLLQYEQWRFPVLSPTRNTDLTVSAQLKFYPRWHIKD